MRKPTVCTKNKHNVLNSCINQKRKKDWYISTVLTVVWYPHCRPVDICTIFKSFKKKIRLLLITVDIYSNFVFRQMIKLLTYTRVLFIRVVN